MPSRSTPLDDFAQEARTFCAWATGADRSAMSVPLALRRVTSFYLAALELPSPFPAGEAEGAIDVEPASDSLAAVERRAAELPFDVSWEVDDPFQTPPVTPDAGSIVDDLVDVYRDVARGLILFDAGQRDEARWEWSFNFRIHWGQHASWAIRALHAFLERGEESGWSCDTPS